VTGLRLLIGLLVMGVAVPVVLFLLLGLHTPAQLLTIALVTFLSWGVADLLATVLGRPRLEDRSPGKALKEDWQRRAGER
jgi:hypothetical protein